MLKNLISPEAFSGVTDAPRSVFTLLSAALVLCGAGLSGKRSSVKGDLQIFQGFCTDLGKRENITSDMHHLPRAQKSDTI